MGQRNALLAAFGAFQHEAHLLALLDGKFAVLQRSDADLRPLQILQDADRAADILLQRAQGGMDLGMIVMGAMAEIQPEDVGAGQEELLQPFRRVAGGADGGDDLGMAMAAHGKFSSVSVRRSEWRESRSHW